MRSQNRTSNPPLTTHHRRHASNYNQIDTGAAALSCGTASVPADKNGVAVGCGTTFQAIVGGCGTRESLAPPAQSDRHLLPASHRAGIFATSLASRSLVASSCPAESPPSTARGPWVVPGRHVCFADRDQTPYPAARRIVTERRSAADR